MKQISPKACETSIAGHEKHAPIFTQQHQHPKIRTHAQSRCPSVTETPLKARRDARAPLWLTSRLVMALFARSTPASSSPAHGPSRVRCSSKKRTERLIRSAAASSCAETASSATPAAELRLLAQVGAERHARPLGAKPEQQQRLDQVADRHDERERDQRGRTEVERGAAARHLNVDVQLQRRLR
eukprot:1924314-Pleurochrysis_carterae.AAC.1